MMRKIVFYLFLLMSATQVFSCKTITDIFKSDAQKRKEIEKQKETEKQKEIEKRKEIEKLLNERFEWVSERAKIMVDNKEKIEEFEEKKEKYMQNFINDWLNDRYLKQASITFFDIDRYIDRKDIPNGIEFVKSIEYLNNPYGYKKNTFYYVSPYSNSEFAQWLSSDTVLIRIDNKLLIYCYGYMQEEQSENIGLYLIYEGTYEYETTMGSFNIVPKFKLIYVPVYNKETLLEKYNLERLALDSYNNSELHKEYDNLLKEIENFEFPVKVLDGFVFVEGTEDGTIKDFYMDEIEVTDTLVENAKVDKLCTSFRSSYRISSLEPAWFIFSDAIEVCNVLSLLSGLEECYVKNDDGKYICDFSKNGYRLLTKAEWNWAYKGGRKSKGYKYSGSDSYDEVAWTDDDNYIKMKKPNELGIYDMSGGRSEIAVEENGDFKRVEEGYYEMNSFHLVRSAVD